MYRIDVIIDVINRNGLVLPIAGDVIGVVYLLLMAELSSEDT